MGRVGRVELARRRFRLLDFERSEMFCRLVCLKRFLVSFSKRRIRSLPLGATTPLSDAVAPGRFVFNFHGIGEPTRALELGEADYWVTSEVYQQCLDAIVARFRRADFGVTFDDSNLSKTAAAKRFP